MNEKSAQKKEYIIDKSRQVFANNGFKSVTMKDLVEACDISRGGLYLYFDSTEAVFKAVIEKERSKSDPELKAKLPENPKNSDLLTLFFVEQKKEIVDKENSLLKALYEFSFYQKEKKHHTILEKQEDVSLEFLAGVLESGIANGEFRNIDPIKTAKHIILCLEGMKIVSRAATLTESDVNNEMVILMESVLPIKAENVENQSKEKE